MENNDGAAAIYNKDSDMTMYRMTIRNNTTTFGGAPGGIYSGGATVGTDQRGFVREHQGVQ